MQRQKQKSVLRDYDEFLKYFHKKIDFYTHLLDNSYRAPREISELRTQVQKKMSELKSKDLDDDLMKELYLRSFKNAREQAIILESRNRKNEMVTSGSRKLWGEPDYKNYRKAVKMLKGDEKPEKIIEDLGRDKQYSSEDMKKWLEAVFEELEINGWTVHLKQNTNTISVSSAHRKINLPRNRSFSEHEAFRLALHEIGRHVLTFENGEKQDYKVLGLGVGGYERIDEGVAAYMEKKSGLITEDVLKKYAARLVAVFQMNNGRSKREIRKNFEKLNLDHEMSDNILERVFTGGGLSRDHIYLEGLFRTEKYMENGGNLGELFIGKVPLQYCKKLKSRNEIKTPDRDIEDLTTEFYSKMRPLWERKLE